MYEGSKDRIFDVDCRKIPEKIPRKRESGKNRNFVSKWPIFRTCRIFEKYAEKKTPKRVILDQNQKVGW